MKFRILTPILICFSVMSLQAQVDRSKMPEPGPAPEINLGTPSTFKLKNGLKVLVVENHKFPKVRLSLTLDNKPYSQGDKIGLKALYSSMMGTGTKEMDKEAFNERIDFLGASVGYGSQSAYASSLSRFFPEVFELMADGLLNPDFDEEEFDTQKKRLVEGIKSQQNSASAIADNVKDVLSYGKNHPYGEFETIESVEEIQLSDVENYYRQFISPKNAYIVVVGDIKTDEVKKLVNKYLKDWNAATPPTQDLPKVENVSKTEIDFVDVPNAVQSEVSVVNTVNLKKTDKDYFAALIANQILGGGADGRLFNNLREDKGYTYGAYSGLGSDKYVSRFNASASVRNAVTDSAVVAFLDEIHLIREQEVNEDELALAKAKYTGNFVRALENPSTVANYAMSIEIDDLPKDFYQNYLKNVNAVTAEDVLRVAKKYFMPGQARIVIAGKGSEIAESLENMTYKGASIPVNYFDKNGNPVDKPNYNKEIPDDITVASIYDKYIEAIGGKEAVEGVNSLYMELGGEMGPQSITMKNIKTKDGKSSMVIEAAGMVIQKRVFDGEKGYTEAQGQRQDFSEEEIEDAKAQAGLFPELQVPEDAEVAGYDQVDGEEAYIIKISDDTSEYYSVESGLKLQTVIDTEWGTSTTAYSDYKEVEGVEFPYELSQSFGPQAIDFKIKEIKLNEEVKDEDFN